MQLTQFNNLARVDFRYNPTLTGKINKIKGSRYYPDPLGPYWTVPVGSLLKATQSGVLSPGYLSPHFLHLVSPDIFNQLSVEIKEDRLKISGKIKLALLIQSLYDLCSYEYINKNADEQYIIESLVTVGKNKNDIVILFPKGLYSRVITFLRYFRFKSFIEHPLKAKPERQLDLQCKIQPRPYQQQACNKITQEEIPNRATLVMATGSGKTLLSANIIAQLGIPCVFFTYSLDLLEQTAEVFNSALGVDIGKVGGRYFNIQPITVASIQTVYSCMEKQDARWDKLKTFFDTVGCQFIDEGHMLGADTIFAVASKIDAYYSYALTATPQREDGKEIYIEAATGPVIELITEEELVRQGYILPVQVELYSVQHFATRVKKYHKLYNKEIIDHWERTRKTVRAVNSHEGKQVIVLVKEIYHGNKLAELLNAPFIHGTTSSKDRQKYLQKFKDRKINVLIASSILKQGVDLPEAEVLVLAHGGSSLVELMQKVGRVRRPSPGKTVGVVVDFYDAIKPEADNDIFRAQSLKRIAMYQKKGFQIIKKGSDSH